MTIAVCASTMKKRLRMFFLNIFSCTEVISIPFIYFRLIEPTISKEENADTPKIAARINSISAGLSLKKDIIFKEIRNTRQSYQ